MLSWAPGCNIWFAMQNHNYAVDPESLPEGVQVTHVNLNDQSCAGLVFPKMKLMSLQYHPESSPGPHDSDLGTYNSLATIRMQNRFSQVKLLVPFHVVNLSWLFLIFWCCSVWRVCGADEEQQIMSRRKVGMLGEHRELHTCDRPASCWIEALCSEGELYLSSFISHISWPNL
jgi:hypothetical protein